MAASHFRCCNCHKIKRCRVKGQKYCSAKKCQQERKNAWRRRKYKANPEYRRSVKHSTQKWLESVGGEANYTRDYRQGVRRRNRSKDENISPKKVYKSGRDPRKKIADRKSNQHCAVSTGNRDTKRANSDAKSTEYLVESESYIIVTLTSANRDALLAKIPVIPGTKIQFANRDSFYIPP